MKSYKRSTTASVRRDYWRLELKPADGEPELLTIAGRRRTTEAFWPPLELPASEINRVLAAVGHAAALTARIACRGCDQIPVFPAHDVRAICRGPYYVIELAETTCGDCPSVQVTFLQTRGAIRPAILLIDDELSDFAADLEEIAALMALDPTMSAPVYQIHRGEHITNGEHLRA